MNTLNELQQRYQALKEERQSWEKDWRLLAEHFLPRKCRMESEAESLTNKGGLRHNKLDSTAFYAMRDLSAGLHGGLTSPARPWFALTLQDQITSKNSKVRRWLDDVSERMRFIYHRSNFYNAISSFYAELATFGTAFMFELEDERTVVRFVPLTAGEYCLDTDASGRVDTVFRSVPMTLRQLEQEFGREKLPENLRNMLENSQNWSERFPVVHAVVPAANWARCKPNMAFASVYYLEGQGLGSGTKNWGSKSGGVILREGGFEEFPGFGVRWDITGNDVYGKGPAYDTLADSVLLQQMSQTMLKALHKEIDPPLAAPAGFENVSLLPGAVNPVNPLNGSAQAIYPIMQVRHNIQGTYEVIAQIQNKVREGLFNNLFRMLLNSDRRQITAREVAAREEEKLILIGPVLERLNDEFFIPLTSRTFNIMERQNWLPPAPEAIQNMELNVEFVSILAQAQKMVATGTIEQFAMFVGNVARMYPDALDSIEVDAMVDNYAEYLGVASNMLKGQDKREEERQTRLAQQQQMQQMQQQMAAVSAAQKLGSARVDNTALGSLQNLISSPEAGASLMNLAQNQNGA